MGGRACGWVGRGIGGALLAALAACASAPPAGPRPSAQAALPPPAPLTTTVNGTPQITRDFDGDGLISASEAAGYYARRFGELDQNSDGWLSRDEIAGDSDEAAEPGLLFDDLDLDADAQVSSDEYFQSGASRFQQRINPNTGMMSTSDFDTMIRYADPPVTDEVEPALE